MTEKNNPGKSIAELFLTLFAYVVGYASKTAHTEYRTSIFLSSIISAFIGLGYIALFPDYYLFTFLLLAIIAGLMFGLCGSILTNKFPEEGIIYLAAAFGFFTGGIILYGTFHFWLVLLLSVLFIPLALLATYVGVEIKKDWRNSRWIG